MDSEVPAEWQLAYNSTQGLPPCGDPAAHKAHVWGEVSQYVVCRGHDGVGDYDPDRSSASLSTPSPDIDIDWPTEDNRKLLREYLNTRFIPNSARLD